MDVLFQDIRYGWRTMMRSRGFAVIAALCLALGIGVNTAIFSIVRGLLFRSLPFAPGDRLTVVYATNAQHGTDEGELAFGDLQDLRSAGVFTQVEAMTGRSVTLTEGDIAERLESNSVTPGLFAMLGVQPQLGRLFRAEEGATIGQEQVVLLSDNVWRGDFGSDPNILNRSIHVNGRELKVVGVMPKDFNFPERSRLWLPLGSANPVDRQHRFLQPLGVLRPGVTMKAANDRIASTAERWTREFDGYRGWSARALSYRDSLVDANAQKLMYIMLGAVAFVLLIACANVANLLLARASDREREIALRSALGASRGRVVRQLLTESVLLALAGGAAGLLVSSWWVDAMTHAIPEELPFWAKFTIDRGVLLYTLLLVLGTGVLFGLLPALQATRADLQSMLREDARTVSQSRAQNRWRSALVVGEIALAVILVAGAALLMQSFLRLQAASPGFATDHLLSFRITIAGDRYDPLAAKAHYFQNAAERLALLPGVQGAAFTSAIPADDGGPHVSVRAEGDARSTDEALTATQIADGAGLWAALGLHLSAGRDFNAQELADTAARVAIVGEYLARKLWPNADPIGRRLLVGDQEYFTVIGVAPYLQYEEFGEETAQDSLQFHVPFAQWGTRGMAFLLRTNGDPDSWIAPMRKELRAIDATLAPWDIQSTDTRRRFTTWPQRIFGKIFGTFGGTALLLALAGVYGVMAHSVARRRRELGVRIALGARSADVLRLVIGRALGLTALGVLIGVVGAFAVTRLLTGIIFSVSVTDPATFVLTPVLLTAAALLASYIPARRATRVDPIAALRAE